MLCGVSCGVTLRHHFSIDKQYFDTKRDPDQGIFRAFGILQLDFFIVKPLGRRDMHGMSRLDDVVHTATPTTADSKHKCFAPNATIKLKGFVAVIGGERQRKLGTRLLRTKRSITTAAQRSLLLFQSNQTVLNRDKNDSVQLLLVNYVWLLSFVSQNDFRMIL